MLQLLSRLRRRRALRRQRPGFHSSFGGLWTDTSDAEQQLATRVADGRCTAAEGALLAGWIRDGYAILPGAVDDATLERLRGEIARMWTEGHPDALIEVGNVYSPLQAGDRPAHAKLLDLHVLSATAREAVFAPALQRFLDLVFDRDALAFQSLTFETGSEQPIHQDTAYVVVDPPLEFCASWIALEDVQPGSGELAYYPGSHRLPDHVFAGGGRNWNRQRDGEQANLDYLEQLVERSEALGRGRATFLPKRGDVLVWANDLAHGGSPVTDPDSTRRSLVTHYCPSDAEPYYTSYRPTQARRRQVGQRSWIASSYYDVG